MPATVSDPTPRSIFGEQSSAAGGKILTPGAYITITSFGADDTTGDKIVDSLTGSSATGISVKAAATEVTIMSQNGVSVLTPIGLSENVPSLYTSQAGRTIVIIKKLITSYASIMSIIANHGDACKPGKLVISFSKSCKGAETSINTPRIFTAVGAWLASYEGDIQAAQQETLTMFETLTFEAFDLVKGSVT